VVVSKVYGQWFSILERGFMAQISIRKSISYGLSSYWNNFSMVTGAGFIFGLFSWAFMKLPKLIVLQLGMAHEQSVPGLDQFPVAAARIFDGLGVQWRTTIVGNDPKGAVLIGVLSLLFVILYYWAYLGYLKLLLSVGDSKKITSLTPLFKGSHNLVSAIAAFFLLIGCLMAYGAVWIASIALLMRIHYAFAFIGYVLGLLGLFYGMCSSILSQLFIVDKSMKALDSLKASWKYSQGNIVKIFFWFIMIMIFSTSSTVLVNGLIKPLFSAKIVSLIATVLTVGFMGGIWNLSFIHMYRTVTADKN